MLFKLYNQTENSLQIEEEKTNGKELTTPWKSQRNIDVFCSYRLYPWLTCKRNKRILSCELTKKTCMQNNCTEYEWLYMNYLFCCWNCHWFLGNCMVYLVLFLFFVIFFLFVSLVTSHQEQRWSHLLCVFLVVVVFFLVCTEIIDLLHLKE